MGQLLNLAHGLEKDLSELRQSDFDIKELAHLSTIKCRDLLRTFKKEVLKNGFSSRKEEILFFKTVKQIPMVPLIYFSEIHSFEIQFPKANRKAQQKFIVQSCLRTRPINPSVSINLQLMGEQLFGKGLSINLLLDRCHSVTFIFARGNVVSLLK